jgi:hypothetical protein
MLLAIRKWSPLVSFSPQSLTDSHRPTALSSSLVSTNVARSGGVGRGWSGFSREEERDGEGCHGWGKVRPIAGGHRQGQRVRVQVGAGYP